MTNYNVKTKVVGVDISNEITTYAIVDIRGNIIVKDSFPTQDYLDASQFVNKLADSIAFVRRGGRGAAIVVQNWTDRRVSCEVSFDVPKAATPSYLASDETDRSLHGGIASAPLHARDARFVSPRGFELGPWGRWISAAGDGEG